MTELPPIDPVCVFHGMKWSEHEGGRCLYCCICFKTLTPDECAIDYEGVRWDVCTDPGCIYMSGIKVLEEM